MICQVSTFFHMDINRFTIIVARVLNHITDGNLFFFI